MTTLYKPVPITSVDSLDALAPGIVVHCGPLVALKDSTYGWSQNLHQETNIKPAMIWRTLERLEQAGFTAHALVPVEVEEETVVDTADLDLDPEHEYRSDDPNLLDAVRNAPKRTRYTTPWKTSGPSPHRRGGCA